MSTRSRHLAGLWLTLSLLLCFAGAAFSQAPGTAVTGTFGGLVLNRATGTFNSVLTLTNTGNVALQSPILLVISTGTPAVTISGSPGGPFAANVAGGSLLPGGKTTVVVPFSNPTRVPFTPTLLSAIAAPATTITGQVAVGGFVLGAAINAYTLTPQGTQGALVAGPVTTDSNGVYTLTIPDSFNSGPLLIVSAGGSYVDEVTGRVVDLTNSSLQLSAILESVNSATSNTAQITPLTAMAAQIALGLVQNVGTSPQPAAQKGNGIVGFEFFPAAPIGSVPTTPILNLTQPSCNSTPMNLVTSDVSLFMAGLSTLANQYEVSTEALLSAMIQDVVLNASFTGYVNGIAITVPSLVPGNPPVPLFTIEGGTVNTLPGLASAIQTFQASSANACQRMVSAATLAALNGPLFFRLYTPGNFGTESLTYTGPVGALLSISLGVQGSSLSYTEPLQMIPPSGGCPAGGTVTGTTAIACTIASIEVSIPQALASKFSYYTLLPQAILPGGLSCSGSAVGAQVFIPDPFQTQTTFQIVCDAPALHTPGGLAFQNGQLYVANSGGNNVLIYSVQYGPGNAVTGMSLVNTITTDLFSPDRLTFDSTGKLFVANLVGTIASAPGSITVYDTTNNNQEVIADRVVAHDHPLAVAVDDSGILYVGNNSGNSISVYTPTAGGGFTEIPGSPFFNDMSLLSISRFTAPGAMLYQNVPGYGKFLIAGFGPTQGANHVNLWLTPFSGNSVSAYALANIPIPGGPPCLDPSGPSAFAFSNFGNTPQLYVADLYNSDIAIFNFASFQSPNTIEPPGSTASPVCPPPSTVLTDNINGPEGVALDTFGNIFVSNTDSITVLGPSGSLQYTLH